MKTWIPFCGFYNSFLDGEDVIDNQYYYLYEKFGYDTSKHHYVNIVQSIDKNLIGERYTEYFKNAVDDIIGYNPSSLSFIKVTSPREYNFETDQVHVDISENDITNIYNTIDHDDFAAWLEQRLKPYSWFIPFDSYDESISHEYYMDKGNTDMQNAVQFMDDDDLLAILVDYYQPYIDGYDVLGSVQDKWKFILEKMDD